MKLSEFSYLLTAHPDKPFHLILPGESMVPVSFHITEVAHVTKRFVDCGGKLHTAETCQLQAWLGPDTDHRLRADKMARVLALARTKGVLPDDDLDVEIEYEEAVVSQYTLDSYVVVNNEVVFHFGAKHTDCLAKATCLPTLPLAAESKTACCGPGCCQ